MHAKLEKLKSIVNIQVDLFMSVFQELHKKGVIHNSSSSLSHLSGILMRGNIRMVTMWCRIG